jgi:hypothetical protein
MKKFLLILLLAGSWPWTFAQNAPGDWAFVVSGDSRNCGDVVMPAIAEGARHHHAAFYWHLGDLRELVHVDEDYAAEPEHRGKTIPVDEYKRDAWNDYIHSQIAPFGDIPFLVGIGNHELVEPKTRAEFLATFAQWLDAPALRKQRLADDPTDTAPHTYFHWMEHGVDFLYLDNATLELYNFDEPQLKWFHDVLSRDAADPKIKTLVVGMHAALPDSIARGHSMSDSVEGIVSGRRAYLDLLKLQKAGKHVYVLASHSHFFLSGIFNTEYWNANGGVLPGWIVGTAGAVRYALPARDLYRAGEARQKVYGYLLGTVHSNGTIDFDFQEIKQRDVPAAVVQRYPPELVNFCFERNTYFQPPSPPPAATVLAPHP